MAAEVHGVLARGRLRSGPPPHLSSLDPAVPEAWEEEPACIGQAARKSEGIQLPFSFSSPGCAQGVSLTLKGLVLSCLRPACPWLSRFCRAVYPSAAQPAPLLGMGAGCWEVLASVLAPVTVCKPGPASSLQPVSPVLLPGSS